MLFKSFRIQQDQTTIFGIQLPPWSRGGRLLLTDHSRSLLFLEPPFRFRAALRYLQGLLLNTIDHRAASALHSSADSLSSEIDYDYSYATYGHHPQTFEMARVPTYGVASATEESSPHEIDTETINPGSSGESDALLGERSQEPLIKKREGHATIQSSVGNLANTIIGSGTSVHPIEPTTCSPSQRHAHIPSGENYSFVSLY